MNIVFFAARQLHKEYFSKLAQQLTQRLNKKPNPQDTQHSVDVLWHKSLWKNLLWLSCLIPAFKTDLDLIINDHIHENRTAVKAVYAMEVTGQSFAP
jgi:hypothetical protein